MVTTTSSSSERMMAPELVVTGEAVALEVVPATVGARVLSGMVDYGLYLAGLAVTLVTWAILTGAMTGDTQVSRAALATQSSLLTMLWMVGIPLCVEVASRGGSAGRLVTGCRVVRDDGGAVRLRHCLVRVLVGVVEIWVLAGMPAIIAAIVTRRGKRLGDLLAGTYVVRTRSAASRRPPLVSPPELEQWARGADLTALPGELTLVCRTFLQRASELRPEARARIGTQLAAQVEGHVAPPPPAGTHPERFLAAVLVERRDRELVLETRDRALDEAARREMARLPHEVREPGA